MSDNKLQIRVDQLVHALTYANKHTVVACAKRAKFNGEDLRRTATSRVL